MSHPPERVVAGELTIRRWRGEDAPALAAAIAASIDHLRGWMSWAADWPLTSEARSDLLAGWERDWDAGRDRLFGMFVGRDVAGACGLHPRIGPGGLEIGYWVHAAHVRKGYATQAAGALMDIAFALPEITHVEIHHDRANIASGGVPRKLGLRFVGEERDEISAPDEVGVSCVWRIERPEWQRR